MPEVVGLTVTNSPLLVGGSASLKSLFGLSFTATLAPAFLSAALAFLTGVNLPLLVATFGATKSSLGFVVVLAPALLSVAFAFGNSNLGSFDVGFVTVLAPELLSSALALGYFSLNA